MKEVVLKRITLKNYMGAEDVEVDFSKKTEIRGKNRCGKSTLMNAYFDIMTGKLANGAAPNNICPVNADGTEKPVKEIERTILLSVDGEEHEIRKITKRKYRKDVFIGNETVYKLDGDDVKAADINAFLSEIAPAETVSMCSNASVFMSVLKKSTAEARKNIETLSGFDIEKFCKSNEEYHDVYTLMNGKNTEDVLKQLKKKCTAENAELDKLNIEIAYETKRLSEMDKTDIQKIESEKSVILGRIKEANEAKNMLVDAIDRCTFLVSHKEVLREKMSEIKAERQNFLNQQLTEREIAITKKEHEIEKLESAKNEISKCIAETEETVKRLEDRHEEIKSMTFDEKTKCPACGRDYTEKELRDAKDRFEQKRNEQLKLASNTLEDAIPRLAAKRAEYAEFVSIVEKMKESLIEGKNDLEEMRKSASKIHNEKPNTEEYNNLEKELQRAEEEYKKLLEANSLWQMASDRIIESEKELAQKKAEIRAIIRDTEDTENRIEELKESAKKQAQKVADVEQQIDMLSDFSVDKNAALEKMANSKFEFIKIRMSEETLSGDLKETLRINVNGIDYFSGLNHGDRILAEIFLLKGLQDMNGIKLPIWIDDTESLDGSRIPDIGRQMIMIRRTDEEKLNVCRVEV